jgi:hypothetical protein
MGRRFCSQTVRGGVGDAHRSAGGGGGGNIVRGRGGGQGGGIFFGGGVRIFGKFLVKGWGGMPVFWPGREKKECKMI